jgi:hypothetical protein
MRTISNKKELPGERSFKIQVSDVIYLAPSLSISPTMVPKSWRRPLLLSSPICVTTLELKSTVLVKSKSQGMLPHSNLHAANILEPPMISNKEIKVIPSRRVTLCLSLTVQDVTQVSLTKRVPLRPHRLLRKI